MEPEPGRRAVTSGALSKFGVDLEPAMRSDAAARRIHLALLDRIRANEDGVRRRLDPEFLHDFRVAVRRTRSCLGQVRGVFPADAVGRFRVAFSWLGKLTGPARDLDVYLLEMPRYRAGLPEAVRDDLAPLERFLERHCLLEHERLAAELGSERYRALIEGWTGFLEREPVDDPSAPNARRPILEVATDRIAGVYRKVLKKGRAIDADSPPDKLHRLRIECKKLRYLLEFFQSLLDPADLAPTLKSLRRLQDNLGTFNDLQVQRRTLTRYAQQMAEERCATVEALMAMGRLVERLRARQGRERRRFAKRFACFDERDARQRVERLVRTRTGIPS
jgi:CHAD domain-containing protein